MNTKNLVLSILVIITVLLASIAIDEYSVTNSLSSQITSIQSKTTTETVTRTSTTALTTTTTLYSVTILSTTMNATTSCSATGGLGCLHFIDMNWTISVNYSGPWGVNYQGWLGDISSGQLVTSGSFFGDSPGARTVSITGWSDLGNSLCAQAQKLDASNSTLSVTILPPLVSNQTSAAYGTTQTCISDFIG